MAFHKEAHAFCPKCKQERDFKIEHAIVDYWGITHVLVCTGCNTVVPEFAFSEYIKTGKIIIPV